MRKITAPELPPTVLHRPQLIETLRAGLVNLQQGTQKTSTWYKLFLLCSPAGYGKTTLLADMASHIRIPCCWFMLDALDNDVNVFWETFVASIRQHVPHFGVDLNDFLPITDLHTEDGTHVHHSAIPFMDAFLAALEYDIDQQCVLILCNYHEVNENRGINALINYLLHKLPSKCTLVIESRALPHLEFMPLLAHRQMIGIGSSELRFTPQDICQLSLLLQNESCSLDEAEKLCTAFDGWISGILLGTHLGSKKFLPSFNSALTGLSLPADRQHLFSYLISEVFAKEPEFYAFLRDLSILQQMTPDLCNVLLATTDAQARLAYIEQQGLFVTRSEDDHGYSYTCHPVLNELLSQELRTRYPQRYQTLHQRAAQLFAEQGEYQQAIAHAFAAEDYPFAAKLLAKIARTILRKGYIENLAQWLHELPPDVLNDDPRLLLASAHIHLIRFEIERALPLLQRAHILSLQEAEATTLIAEILLAQSVTLFRQGLYLQTQQICQQVMELLPEDEQELRAQVYQRLGACACLLGDVTTGIAHLQRALQIWRHHTETRQTALLHSYLANAYNMVSNYPLAEHHRRRAIQYCEQLRDDRGKIHNLIGLSSTKRSIGALADAEYITHQALTLARDIHFRSGEAYALINQGEIFQDQGLFEQSLVVVEDALVLARSLQDSYLMNYALCILALGYLFVGDPHTALQYVDETQVKDNDAKSYEGILCNLTRGIILFHQKGYEEAYTYFCSFEQSLEETKCKPFFLRILLYQAACSLALGKVQAAQQILSRAKSVTQQDSLKPLLTIELRRLPTLDRLMQESIPADEPIHHPSTASSAVDSFKENTDRPAVAPVEPVQIYAFGEPMVYIDGAPIKRWRMARSMELFFHLLDAGRAVHKEQIMTALWPQPDDHMDQNLRATIYYLRKAVGETAIVHNSGTYALNLAGIYGEDIWYDVKHFQHIAAQVKENSVAQKQEESLSKMVELYRGDYLQTCYSDWSMQRRDELRQMYFQALQQLAGFSWKRQQLDACVFYWQKILTIDNCYEDAHYCIMRCYLKQGKRTDAIRQYQECAAILQQELSIVPGPPLQKLYQQLNSNRAF